MRPQPDSVVAAPAPEVRRGVAPAGRAPRRQDGADLVGCRDARDGMERPRVGGVPFFWDGVEGEEAASQGAGLLGRVGEGGGGVPVALGGVVKTCGREGGLGWERGFA